jgi:hypothetical protein
MSDKRLPRPRDPIQLGKITPAMAAGITPKLWEMSDMIKVLEDWEIQQPAQVHAPE